MEIVEESTRLTTLADSLVIMTTNLLKTSSSMMDAYAAFKRQTQPTVIVTENKTYLSNGVTENTGWASGSTARTV